MKNYSGFIKSLQDIMRNDAGINGDAQRIEQIVWMLFLKVYDVKENDWELADRKYKSIIPEKYRWRNWAYDDGTGNVLTGDDLLSFVNNEIFPFLKKIVVTPETPIKKSIVKTTFEDANQYMKDGVLLRQVINIIDNIELDDYENIHAFGDIYETILKDLQSAGNAGEFYTPRAVTEFMASKVNPQIGDVMADFACGTGGFITSWLKELEKKVKTSKDREKYDNSVYGIEKKQFPYMLCITNLLLHGLDNPQVIHGNSLLRDLLDYTDDDKFDVLLMNPPYGGSEKNDVKNHFPSDLASSETADLFMDVCMYRLKENGRCAIILPDGFLFGNDNAKINIKKKLLNDFNLHTIIRMPSSVFAPYTSIATNILFFDNNGSTKETWFYRMDMPDNIKHFSKTNPMKREHFNVVDEWWNNRKEIKDIKVDESQTETYKSKKYTLNELEDLGYNLDQCGYPVEEKIILSPVETLSNFIDSRNKMEESLGNALNNFNEFINGNTNVELKNIANFTYSISKMYKDFSGNMKDSILQAAMKGKLTKQLKNENTNVVKTIIEGNSKYTRIFNNEIPKNWAYVQLKDIVEIINGFTPLRTNHEFWNKKEIPWFTVEDIHKQGRFINDTEQYITQKALSKGSKRLLPKDSILLCCTASVGEYAYSNIELTTNQQFNGLVVKELLKNEIYPMYLYYYVQTLKNKLIINSGKTTFNFLSTKKLGEFTVSLPPIEEQHRIVDLLDKLLPLCDEIDIS